MPLQRLPPQEDGSGRASARLEGRAAVGLLVSGRSKVWPTEGEAMPAKIGLLVRSRAMALRFRLRLVGIEL